MKTIVYIFILLFALSDFCRAQNNETQFDADKRYFEVLKKIKIKINKAIRPSKTNVVRAVIGVRGNRYDSKRNLYWKSDFSPKLKEKISEEANKISGLIENFNPHNPQSIKNIEDYLSENPNSYFSNELKKLLLNKTETKTQ